MKSFTSIHLLVLTLGITQATSYAANSISIEEAAKKGLIKVSIKSKGGYTGNVIAMKIKNLTAKKIDLKLEAGRILDSKNNNEQNLLVTQSQYFIVNASETKDLNVFAMCCQANNGAPTFEAEYSIGKMGDSTLIQLAGFIDKNKLHSNKTAQQALWCVSDNNSLASISNGEKTDITLLQNYVSTITGRPIPAYSIHYRQENGNNVLGRVSKIEGVFDFILPTNCHATMGIYDAQGKLVQLIFENIAHQKGDYNIYYTFKTKDLPKGMYYARINADGHLHKEMKIEF